MLSARDVAGLVDAEAAQACVRLALEAWADGRAGLSSPRSQYVRAEGPATRFHAKGAFLADQAVAGFRVNGIAGCPAPDASTQVMVLFDLATAAPLAVIACDRLAPLRVGAMAALTVSALRAEGAKTLAVLGAGPLARAAVQAIQAFCPFDAVRVASRSRGTAQAMCEALAAAGCPGAAPVDDAERACRDADAIVTCTSANGALVRAAWCGAGSLLVSMGSGQECEAEAILGADRVYVDDWEQCTLLGDLAVLYREGRIARDRIAGTLADVILGRAAGRGSSRERIVAVPQGLAVLDVALSHLAYREAVEAKAGTRVAWQ